MLQSIRERISGWVAGVIIAIVAGAFVLFGIEYYFQRSAGDQNVAATVNGEKITTQEVNRLYSQMLRNMMARMGSKPVPDYVKKQLRMVAQQSLVTNVALATTLHKEGFRAGMAQVKSVIATVPQFQENGAFSQVRFQQVLAQSGMTAAELIQRLQAEIVVNQATGGVMASAFMLPDDVRHFYKLSFQKRDFGYLTVSPKMFLSKVKVTDKLIANYYKENKKSFETPAEVKVDYILLSPKAIEEKITVSAAQAKSYYESNIINYQVPAKWEVDQVALPVAKGASSEAVAKVQKQAEVLASAWRKGHSPKTASSTTFNSAQLMPALHKALSQLKVGDVSAPLRTAKGFAVLKVLQKHPEKTRPFSDVEKSIVAMIKRQKVNQVLSQKSSQLADIAYTSPDSLKPAAKALNLAVLTSQQFSKDGAKSGIFANPKVLKAVFSNTVFKDGDNSDPINLSDGSLIVVRINKKISSQQKPLSAVRAEIEKKLSVQMAEAKAGVLAYQLQKQLLDGGRPVVLAKAHGLKWHDVGLVSRHNKNLEKIPEIANSVFTTPVVVTKNTKKPVGVNTVLRKDGVYAVLSIKSVDLPNDKTVVKEKSQMTKELTQLYAQIIERFYVQSIVSDAKTVLSKNAA